MRSVVSSSSASNEHTTIRVCMHTICASASSLWFSAQTFICSVCVVIPLVCLKWWASTYRCHTQTSSTAVYCSQDVKPVKSVWQESHQSRDYYGEQHVRSSAHHGHHTGIVAQRGGRVLQPWSASQHLILHWSTWTQISSNTSTRVFLAFTAVYGCKGRLASTTATGVSWTSYEGT